MRKCLVNSPLAWNLPPIDTLSILRHTRTTPRPSSITADLLGPTDRTSLCKRLWPPLLRRRSAFQLWTLRRRRLLRRLLCFSRSFRFWGVLLRRLWLSGRHHCGVGVISHSPGGFLRKRGPWIGSRLGSQERYRVRVSSGSKRKVQC